mmetsp:Transcript_92004/g.197136  ORF Transcript_92004/g.197136 Transcript_92004/m.197136 type:complete len:438 (+) Transcript_92004:1046-2359(+)
MAPGRRQLDVFHIEVLRELTLRQRGGFLHLASPGYEDVCGNILAGGLVTMRLHLHLDVTDGDLIAKANQGLPHTGVAERDHCTAHGAVLPHRNVLTDLFHGLAPWIFRSVKTLDALFFASFFVLLGVRTLPGCTALVATTTSRLIGTTPVRPLATIASALPVALLALATSLLALLALLAPLAPLASLAPLAFAAPVRRPLRWRRQARFPSWSCLRRCRLKQHIDARFPRLGSAARAASRWRQSQLTLLDLLDRTPHAQWADTGTELLAIASAIHGADVAQRPLVEAALIGHRRSVRHVPDLCKVLLFLRCTGLGLLALLAASRRPFDLLPPVSCTSALPPFLAFLAMATRILAAFPVASIPLPLLPVPILAMVVLVPRVVPLGSLLFLVVPVCRRLGASEEDSRIWRQRRRRRAVFTSAVVVVLIGVVLAGTFVSST